MKAFAREYWREFLTGAAFALGWFFVSWAIAAVIDRHGSRSVWLFSLGLLCISLGGWSLLIEFAYRGLYRMTREPDPEPSPTPTPKPDA